MIGCNISKQSIKRSGFLISNTRDFNSTSTLKMLNLSFGHSKVEYNSVFRTYFIANVKNDVLKNCIESPFQGLHCVLLLNTFKSGQLTKLYLHFIFK